MRVYFALVGAHYMRNRINIDLTVDVLYWKPRRHDENLRRIEERAARSGLTDAGLVYRKVQCL